MIFTFDSSQVGAPVLSGSAGALRAVIKACLVDGFAAGTVSTLTVASGVAVATFAGAHPYRAGAVARFDGATPAGLNGNKVILSTTAGSVTFDAAGVADGAATGLITHKVAPAGWQELFAGTLTNVLCIKPSSIDASGCSLRLDDTGASNARVRAYSSMTDASTGSGAAPLDTQLSGGLFWSKSSGGNKPWFVVANERCFYCGVAPAAFATSFTLFFAGDIKSYCSGDPYRFFLSGNHTDQHNTSSTPDGCMGRSTRAASNGGFLVRSYTGVGQAIAVQRVGSHHNGATQSVYSGQSGYSFGGYPNAANNGLLTCEVELVEPAGVIRGVMPGLLHAVQPVASSASFAHGTLVDGTDDMAGRRLMAIATAPPASETGGMVFLDITGPWGV